LNNIQQNSNIPSSVNVVLESEINGVYFDNEPILELKIGDRLKAVPLEFLKGEIRYQIWNGNQPIGVVPEKENEILLAAQESSEIECIFGGLVPKKDKKFDCMVKLVFLPKTSVAKTEKPKENTENFGFREFNVSDALAETEDEKVFDGEFIAESDIPFYQRNSFIILMCIFVMPVGFYLLWRYGKQPAERKVFFSIFLVFAIAIAVFSLKNSVNFVGKLITGSTPESSVEAFLYQWQRNDWVSLLEQTPPSWRESGGDAYKLSLWFEDYKDIESYDINEIYDDGENTVCVAVVVINSNRYRLKFNILEENFKDYVDVKDLRSYIDLLEQTSLDKDFSSEDKEGTTYCYADGSSLVYHYSNNCPSAGENLVRMPESNALYRHLGPCGRCAR